MDEWTPLRLSEVLRLVGQRQFLTVVTVALGKTRISRSVFHRLLSRNSKLILHPLALTEGINPVNGEEDWSPGSPETWGIWSIPSRIMGLGKMEKRKKQDQSIAVGPFL